MDNPYDLAFYENRWNEQGAEGRSNLRETWDSRAHEWDAKLRREGVRREQNDARVRDTAAYLRDRGLLGPDCDAVDIGCGPGRFVAEFARTARSAAGVDISPRMTEFAAAYAREQGLSNTSFQALDFQTADLRALGWEGRFDLVFSSITPAVRGLKGLDNLIAMSRGFCFNACFVHNVNSLQDRILRELYDRGPRHGKTSHSQWFYEMFNILWLRGYYPETRYYKQYRELRLPADRPAAEELAGYLLGEEAAKEEDVVRIQRFLEKDAGPDGSVLEVSDCWYGWTLWDVRDRHTRS
jgi:SAM-dependent methyltransferase